MKETKGGRKRQRRKIALHALCCSILLRLLLLLLLLLPYNNDNNNGNNALNEPTTKPPPQACDIWLIQFVMVASSDAISRTLERQRKAKKISFPPPLVFSFFLSCFFFFFFFFFCFPLFPPCYRSRSLPTTKVNFFLVCSKEWATSLPSSVMCAKGFLPLRFSASFLKKYRVGPANTT